MAQYSFYRPHERYLELGEITNPATGEVTQPPSMTKQEFVRECDIHTIIKQYSTTGMLTHVSAKAAQGAYQDLPDPLDYQESLHILQAAESSFMTLPSSLRARFDNDPGQFLAFTADPKNLPEMRTLGLAIPEPILREPPPISDKAPDKEEKAPPPNA